ncbi:MAG: SHOCT domain-containing protein [Acidimicrobiia bacterium]
MWQWNDGWHSMGWFGWSMMVLFWGLVIYAVVWGFRTRQDSTPHDDALEVLKRRYALGEIDREEFEERRQVLDPDRKAPRR